MKITRETGEFQPVNIRIESKEELEMLWDITNTGGSRTYSFWKELDTILPGGKNGN